MAVSSHACGAVLGKLLVLSLFAIAQAKNERSEGNRQGQSADGVLLGLCHSLSNSERRSHRAPRVLHCSSVRIAMHVLQKVSIVVSCSLHCSHWCMLSELV